MAHLTQRSVGKDKAGKRSSHKAGAQDDRRETLAEFKKAVNMTPARLERWLESKDSKRVGWTHEGEHESIGHHSGRLVVKLLRSKQADLSDDDVAHMRKVVGYVHRHLAQRPEGDVSETNWRYSLMNWGHDPLARQ